MSDERLKELGYTIQRPKGKKIILGGPALAAFVASRSETAAGIYDEEKHPRHPKGHPRGGQFKTKAEIEAEKRDEKPETVPVSAKVDDQTEMTVQMVRGEDIEEEALDVQANIRDGLKAVDAVHGVPPTADPVGLIMVPLNEGDLGQHRAYLADDGTMHSAVITINPAEDDLYSLGTIVHETGHYVDIQLGRELGYTQPLSQTEAATAWRKAINETTTVRQLKILRSDFQDRLEKQPQTRHELEEYAHNQEIVRHLDYLLDDQELWARSYAEWVGLRDPNRGRGTDIAYSIHRAADDAGLPIRQWDPDDFRPVAAEFDELFAPYRH